MKLHFNSNFQASEEKQIAIIYHIGRKSLAKIAKAYGVSVTCIHGIVKRNDVTRPNNKLTPEQELEVIKLYQSGKSVQFISSHFNITDAYKILKRHKIDTRPAGHNSRQYQFNLSAFDDLNDEFSAYHLGYLYADGSVSKNTLTLALSIKDLYQVEKLKSFLQTTQPIGLYKTKTPQGKLKDTCRLCIYSKELSAKMKSLGIIKGRNQFHLVIDKLPMESYKHFIRGLVDGDGSLDTSKRNNARLRILGQKDVLNWISKIFESELEVPYREPRQRIGIMELEYGGGAQARKIITWLYKDAQIFLERKIDKMEWW